MAEMICGMISGSSRKARTSSEYFEDTRQRPIAQSVPKEGRQQRGRGTAMTPLWKKLESHSSDVNSFSKCRSENSPLGIDKNRLGVSETGIAISAGVTRNSSKHPCTHTVEFGEQSGRHRAAPPNTVESFIKRDMTQSIARTPNNISAASIAAVPHFRVTSN